MAADGILWGVPVFHMSVPSVVKALLDRLPTQPCALLKQGREVPRFCKAVGVLTNGASRYGGQDLTLSYLANSAILMKGIVVSGTRSRQLHRGCCLDGTTAGSPGEDNILKTNTGSSVLRTWPGGLQRWPAL